MALFDFLFKKQNPDESAALCRFCDFPSLPGQRR